MTKILLLTILSSFSYSQTPAQLSLRPVAGQFTHRDGASPNVFYAEPTVTDRLRCGTGRSATQRRQTTRFHAASAVFVVRRAGYGSAITLPGCMFAQRLRPGRPRCGL